MINFLFGSKLWFPYIKFRGCSWPSSAGSYSIPSSAGSYSISLRRRALFHIPQAPGGAPPRPCARKGIRILGTRSGWFVLCPQAPGARIRGLGSRLAARPCRRKGIGILGTRSGWFVSEGRDQTALLTDAMARVLLRPSEIGRSGLHGGPATSRYACRETSQTRRADW